MKRNELWLGATKIPLEFAIVYASFFLARDVRQISDLIPGLTLPFQTIADEYLIMFALLGAFLYVGLLGVSGGYQILMLPSFWDEWKKVATTSLYWFFIFVAIVFLGNGYLYTTEIPRLIILYALLMITVFVSIERYFLLVVHRILVKKWHIPQKNLLFVGSPKDSLLLDEINDTQAFTLLGYTDKTHKTDENNTLPFLSKEEVLSRISQRKVDEILLLQNSFLEEDSREIFECARIYGVNFRYAANVFEYTKMNTELMFFGSVPVMQIKSVRLTPWGRICKRAVDIFGSVVGIILFSPIMAIIAFIIKKGEPHAPIIYVNRRVGKDGKEIDVYKFRYMKWDYCVKDAYGVKAENDDALKFEQELIQKQNTRQGAIYKIKDDPRKTKIGAFIEKTSLDELPQLFNVLRGEMSLVGPRPHQPREVEKYKEYQKRVLTIKPGITGMAQVFGRHQNSADREVELDIFYIENWSLLLDFKLILRTFGVIIRQ